MRPVVVPTNPPATPSGVTYDQPAILREFLYTEPATGGKRPRGANPTPVNRTVSDGVTALTTLLEKWTGLGAKTRWGDGKREIAFGETVDEKLFQLAYRDSLAKQSGLWGQARRQLIQAIGPYCSYCGLRMDSGL